MIIIVLMDQKMERECNIKQVDQIDKTVDIIDHLLWKKRYNEIPINPTKKIMIVICKP